jgi:hypothetical protein
MRISDEEYFRSCVAKERHLAHLLGHLHIEECYENAGTLWENTTQLPKWTRDWHACGPLLAQYGIDLVFVREDGKDSEPNIVRAGATSIHIKDHPNVERATMVAIVREVIFRLEHHQATPKH